MSAALLKLKGLPPMVLNRSAVPSSLTRNLLQCTSPASKTLCTRTTANQPQIKEALNEVLRKDSPAFVNDTMPPKEHMWLTADADHQTMLNTLPSPKEATTVDTDHCLAIIQALNADSFEIQTFSDVTPEEFEVIAFEREDHTYPKLFYNPELLRLVAMSPLPVHQRAIGAFTECANAFVARYQHPHILVHSNHNLKIHGKRVRDRGVIPDLRLDIQTQYPKYEFPSPFWVMECGFSQGVADMKRKLEKAVKDAPSIDAAFMIDIRDDLHSLPRRDLDHPLFRDSESPLSEKDFIPTSSLDESTPSLQPVIVKGVTWVNIKSVSISVFLRRKDQTFNFDVNKDDPFTACGTLHPQMSVERVTRMLDIAARRLLSRLADKLEEHADNDRVTIHRLRNGAENATFPLDWTLFLGKIQRSLYETAMERYISSSRGSNIPWATS